MEFNLAITQGHYLSCCYRIEDLWSDIVAKFETSVEATRMRDAVVVMAHL